MTFFKPEAASASSESGTETSFYTALGVSAVAAVAEAKMRGGWEVEVSSCGEAGAGAGQDLVAALQVVTCNTMSSVTSKSVDKQKIHKKFCTISGLQMKFVIYNDLEKY